MVKLYLRSALSPLASCYCVLPLRLTFSACDWVLPPTQAETVCQIGRTCIFPHFLPFDCNLTPSQPIRRSTYMWGGTGVQMGFLPPGGLPLMSPHFGLHALLVIDVGGKLWQNPITSRESYVGGIPTVPLL